MESFIPPLNPAVDELQRFNDKARQTFAEELPAYARQGLGDLTRELNRSLEKGKLSLSDFSGTFKNVLGSVANRVGDALITRPLSQAIEGGATSLLGGLFGGARANGGPVQPHRAFLVGERGPELFVPQQAGQIMANGTSTLPAVQVTIQTPNPQSFWQSQAQVQGVIASAVRQAAKRG